MWANIDSPKKASEGKSLDGKGKFTIEKAKPQGQEPELGPPDPKGYAQKEQMPGGGGSIKEKVKDWLD